MAVWTLLILNGENILEDFVPQSSPLEKRDQLKAQIDGFKVAKTDYASKHFARHGYLVDAPSESRVRPMSMQNSTLASPQLVVPINNARCCTERRQCALGQPL